MTSRDPTGQTREANRAEYLENGYPSDSVDSCFFPGAIYIHTYTCSICVVAYIHSLKTMSAVSARCDQFFISLLKFLTETSALVCLCFYAFSLAFCCFCCLFSVRYRRTNRSKKIRTHVNVTVNKMAPEPAKQAVT